MANTGFNDVTPIIPDVSSGITPEIQRYLRGEINNQIAIQSSRNEISVTVTSSKSKGGDFDNIQKAIDYVNQFGGGTILIKPGIYTLSSEIQIYSNISLIGVDDDLCTISNSRINANGSSGNRLKNINIKNLNFSGGIAGQTLIFTYCDKVGVERCIFSGGNDTYITMSNCSRSDVVNNSFSGESKCLDAEYCDIVSFKNNYCDSISSYPAVHYYAVLHSKIIDNSINSSYQGIYLNGSSSYVWIQGNRIINPTDTYIYISGDNNHVVDNLLESGGSGSTQISVSGLRNIISNNNCYSGVAYGLYLSTVATTIVNGNSFQGGIIDSIYISVGANTTIVTSNLVPGGITDLGAATTLANNV